MFKNNIDKLIVFQLKGLGYLVFCEFISVLDLYLSGTFDAGRRDLWILKWCRVTYDYGKAFETSFDLSTPSSNEEKLKLHCLKCEKLVLICAIGVAMP